MIIYLKNNPIIKSDVLAYKEDSFLVKTGLYKYIDYDKHFDKLFMEAVKTFTDTINWKTDKNSTLAKLF